MSVNWYEDGFYQNHAVSKKKLDIVDSDEDSQLVIHKTATDNLGNGKTCEKSLLYNPASDKKLLVEIRTIRENSLTQTVLLHQGKVIKRGSKSNLSVEQLAAFNTEWQSDTIESKPKPVATPPQKPQTRPVPQSKQTDQTPIQPVKTPSPTKKVQPAQSPAQKTPSSARKPLTSPQKPTTPKTSQPIEDCKKDIDIFAKPTGQVTNIQRSPPRRTPSGRIIDSDDKEPVKRIRKPPERTTSQSFGSFGSSPPSIDKPVQPCPIPDQVQPLPKPTPAHPIAPIGRGRIERQSSKDEDLRCLQIMNEARAQEGLPPLAFCDKMRPIALNHCIHMMHKKCEVGHDGADKRFQQMGWVHTDSAGMAENVAWNLNATDPVEQMSVGWLHSPGHRKNIMGNYNMITIAFAYDSDRNWYGTQLFAFVKSQCSPDQCQIFTPAEEHKLIGEMNKLRARAGLPNLVRNQVVHDASQTHIHNVALSKAVFADAGIKTRSGTIFGSGKTNYRENTGTWNKGGPMATSIIEFAQYVCEIIAENINDPSLNEVGMTVTFMEGMYTYLIGFVD